MPAPYFSNNPSDWLALEGLYVSELDPPGFISGVNLNTVAIYGQTVRGPVGEAVEIGSVEEFLQVFGARDYGSGGAIINEVWRALINKPFGSLVIARAAAAAAVAATANFDESATDIIQVDASSVGAWGNNITVSVEDATDGVATHFNLVIKYLGGQVTYQNLNTETASDDNLLEVIGDSNSNLVVVTKLADGRPDNVADTPLTTGAEGTIAASDYTTAFDLVKEYAGPSVVFCASDDNTIIDAQTTNMVTQAPLATDRIFLTWSGTLGDDVAAVETAFDAGITTRSDRIVYCYNSPYTVDPTTSLQIQTPPVEWVASVLSQTFVDIHPGEEATKDFLAGISKLTFPALSRSNYISLKDKGISAFEKDSAGGFQLVSGVTTSSTAGLTEITRRRMADFLQLSMADRIKFYVKKKSTVQNRGAILGEVKGFLEGLKADSSVVEDFEEPQFITTSTQRAQGLEILEVKVRLIGHMLHLVIQTEIGTGVVIEA